jgi:hypothetical protein
MREVNETPATVLNTAPGQFARPIPMELNLIMLHHPKRRFQHPDLFDWLAEQDCRIADHTVRWVARRCRLRLATAQTVAELALLTTRERR